MIHNPWKDPDLQPMMSVMGGFMALGVAVGLFFKSPLAGWLTFSGLWTVSTLAVFFWAAFLA